MANKAAPITIDLEAAAALRLGFFTRCFDIDAVTELLQRLHGAIPANAFDELKRDVNVLRRDPGRRGSQRSSALAKTADRVVSPSDPSRCLYALGAALGECALQPPKKDGSPDRSNLWQYVSELPARLSRGSCCLARLMDESEKGRDLTAVMDSMLHPRKGSILDDDQDLKEEQEAREVYKSSVRTLPSRHLLHVDSVAAFVSRMSQELAASSTVKADTDQGQAEGRRPCLRADNDRQSVYLDDKPFPIEDPVAFYFVVALIAAKGEWRTLSDIVKTCPACQGARVNRLKKKLPFSIRQLVESDRSRGSRIR